MPARKYPLIDVLQKKFPTRSREELIALVYCREVFVDGSVILNPRTKISSGSRVEIKVREFVSRGGKKLERALKEWRIDVEGKVVVDAGASTGGFTDCLLKHGADLVYAVDVGYNQIDYSLRKDKRVVVLERTNIMDLRPETLKPPPDFAVADLSFRSIRGAAARILELVREDFVIALIKPQFEWKSPPPYFKGVVEKSEDLYGILKALIVDLFSSGLVVSRILESPIRGQKGNREFFFEIFSSDAGMGKKRDDLDRVLRRLNVVVF